MPLRDLKGKTFGSLTVVERALPNTMGGKSRWLCLCECGKSSAVIGTQLTLGKTKSCGCLRKITSAKQGRANSSHGDTGTRLWKIWLGMKGRCARNTRYRSRGIVVCDEWLDYACFKRWANNNGYEDFLTIDRIDNDLGYFAENCRWATYKQQERNRANNALLTVNGQTKCLSEWSEITGISAQTLRWRVHGGWRESEMFMNPDLNNKNIRRNSVE